MYMKNIPNILSVFRILLVPVFIVLFFTQNLGWALLIFVLAGITDVVDGFLARHFNWVTNVGKLLDPFADKLMQCSVLICMYLKNLIPNFVVAIYLTKELLMLIGSVFVFKNKNIIVQSDWTGKAATTIFYLAIVLLICFSLLHAEVPYWVVLLICGVAVCSTVFAFINYTLKYLSAQKRHIRQNEKI